MILGQLSLNEFLARVAPAVRHHNHICLSLSLLQNPCQAFLQQLLLLRACCVKSTPRRRRSHECFAKEFGRQAKHTVFGSQLGNRQAWRRGRQCSKYLTRSTPPEPVTWSALSCSISCWRRSGFFPDTKRFKFIGGASSTVWICIWDKQSSAWEWATLRSEERMLRALPFSWVSLSMSESCSRDRHASMNSRTGPCSRASSVMDADTAKLSRVMTFSGSVSQHFLKVRGAN